MSVLKCDNITKEYGKTVALKCVSAEFSGPKIYGLLGRNGAGKSTLINILTNKIFANSGTAYLDGAQVTENAEALGQIFSMSEKSGYPQDLRLTKALKLAKGFYPDLDMEYAQRLADKFELNLNKRIGALSTGFTTIYKLIFSLASNAPVCIYDEPVLGLDAAVRDMFYKELVKSYVSSPRLIIISTHLIEEIADILEHVIVLSGGAVIADSDTESFLRMFYKVSGKAADVEDYCIGKDIIHSSNVGNLKTAMLRGKAGAQSRQADLKVSYPTLQEIFISITGRSQL